jgi:tetratricopeptide (TPR) repeat protein
MCLLRWRNPVVEATGWPFERELESALKERPNEWFYRLILGRLKLFQSDARSVKEICRTVADQLDDFKRRDDLTPRMTDARIAHEVATVWLQQPCSVESIEALKSITEKSKDNGNSGKRNMGMLDYRMGNFEQAAQRLKEAAIKDRRGGLVFNLYFQAMANHKLGRAEEARRLFDEGRTQFAAAYPSASQGDYGVFWRDWPNCVALEREAREVLGIAP